jgi:hypothetical protein
LGKLAPKPCLDNFDVEFSATGLVLLENSYTYSVSLYRSTRFEYDADGRLIRCTERDSGGGPVSVSERQYSPGKCEWIERDAGGCVVCRGLDEYDGERLVRLSLWGFDNSIRRIKSFEYSGNMLSHAESCYHKVDGSLYERAVTEYDSLGRVSRTYGLKADGSPVGDGKYTFEYDPDGRVSKVWTFDEFTNDDTATSVTLSQYVDDAQGNWIEHHECHVWRKDAHQSRKLTTRTLTYYPGQEVI